MERDSGYIYMFSIGRSNVYSRRTLSLVERPVALTVDERGQLFIADISQTKVRQLDTRLAFQPLRDIALLQHSPYTITAHRGFLAVTYREKNVVLIHKYEDVK